MRYFLLLAVDREHVGCLAQASTCLIKLELSNRDLAKIAQRGDGLSWVDLFIPSKQLVQIAFCFRIATTDIGGPGAEFFCLKDAEFITNTLRQVERLGI